jgi:hypothetical protein
MIEITNPHKTPIQIIVRSSRAANEMTVVNVPGVGKGKNKILIEDHIHTPYIDEAEKSGYITQRILND